MRYFEEYSAGYGAMAARAALHSDADGVDLAGEWAFRLAQTAVVETDGFEAAGYDDTAWNRLPVPSHWDHTVKPPSTAMVAPVM